jgi:hypothetical protein
MNGPGDWFTAKHSMKKGDSMDDKLLPLDSSARVSEDTLMM